MVSFLCVFPESLDCVWFRAVRQLHPDHDVGLLPGELHHAQLGLGQSQSARSLGQAVLVLLGHPRNMAGNIAIG